VKISIIVTTYNWKEALALCLESVLAQTRLPDEIVVADDGSRDDTAELVRAYMRKSPVPLIHVWHPDEGFQLSKIRNRGIAGARGDYIVQLDGDMIANRFFIEDHGRIAKANAFVQGKRSLLSPESTSRILKSKTIRVGAFSRGVKFSHRRFLLRSRCLSWLFSSTNRRARGTLGCNMAYWRSDAIRVNGYDEQFVIHGGEDLDFALRLLHLGLKRQYMKHLAFGAHLYHPCRGNPEVLDNESIVQRCQESGAISCSRGIDQYMHACAWGNSFSAAHRSERRAAS
jgi:glycosyltransferase involved in cell wall biosynthesis